MDIRTFHIVGVGRSGTTLLMSMLNAHPEIVLPPESQFFSRYVIRKPRISSAKFLDLVDQDHRFQRLGITPQTVRDLIVSLEGDFSAARFYQAFLHYYAELKDTEIIGDKAPKNIEYLPSIKALLPQTRILHIIRDPRDVYLSRTKAEWSSHYPATAHYVAYRSQYLLGTRLGAKLFGEGYYQVRYEDLLSNPENELRSICSWLDVDYSEDTLQFSRSARELVSPEEKAWKKEALGPLLQDNQEKWKKELSRSKVRAIETACSPAFQDQCYQRSSSPRTIIERMRLCLISAAIIILSTLYRAWVLFQNWRAQQFFQGRGQR